ncbi:hypothetical protein PTKIN_Ptkin19aG0120500 [Pterospermum kingtungense]
MLLRSSSTPILKTCIVQSSAAAAAAADSVHRIPSKPISLTASPINRIQRASSDGNMKQYAVRKKQKVPGSPMGSPKSVKEEDFNDDVRTLSLVGGGAGGEGGVEGFGDWDQGKQRMDEYYENMIRTYPGETLLLANYSKFLKEVRGDLVKAEEYCERAVQVNPDDGEILSMYGDLIWANHGDGARAQSYFDRAVEASPNDWYQLCFFPNPFEHTHTHIYIYIYISVLNFDLSSRLCVRHPKPI